MLHQKCEFQGVACNSPLRKKLRQNVTLINQVFSLPRARVKVYIRGTIRSTLDLTLRSMDLTLPGVWSLGDGDHHLLSWVLISRDPAWDPIWGRAEMMWITLISPYSTPYNTITHNTLYYVITYYTWYHHKGLLLIIIYY